MGKHSTNYLVTSLCLPLGVAQTWGKGLCFPPHFVHLTEMYLSGISSLASFLPDRVETTAHVTDRTPELTSSMTEPMRGCPGCPGNTQWGTDADVGGVTSTSNSKESMRDHRNQPGSSYSCLLHLLSLSDRNHEI